MKKILLLMLFLSGSVFSQTATVSVDENYEIRGDSIKVALNIKDFTEVASLTIHITYDNSVLEWGQILNVNPQFSGLLAGSTSEEIILAWYSLAPQTVTEAELLELQFVFKGGISEIGFDARTSQVTNMSVPLAVNYISGSIGNLPAPGKVNLISPINNEIINTESVEFIWEKEKSAEIYSFQLSDKDDFSNIIYENSIISDTTVRVEDLVDGTNYFWKAAAGNIAGTGDYSDVHTFSIPLLTPTNLTVAEVNSLSDLSWTDNSLNEAGYYILRKENAGSEFIIIDSVETDINTYTDSLVVLNGRYIYSVKAFNTEFISENSNEAELTIITDVEEEVVPAEFKLNQNYPNPFNPETRVSFSVSANSHVQISVFDTLGKKIKKLVDENKSPGNYNVTFNGSNLASGTYLIKMEADSFTETVKAVLVK
ncbi:MAG: T9SS type A sorting domain-containing protein [Melioribacteraceae bacterium]|nr:T9SS type A sorting domain-containing protein [Melioribacteraceae bacterium]